MGNVFPRGRKISHNRAKRLTYRTKRLTWGQNVRNWGKSSRGRNVLKMGAKRLWKRNVYGAKCPGALIYLFMILYCFTEINQIKNIYVCLCVGSKDVGLYAGLPSYTIVYSIGPTQARAYDGTVGYVKMIRPNDLFVQTSWIKPSL